ncbi:hypothetical protein CVT26_003761 [Gymnopilus dilepis]|uniref:ABC transporter domain-containing protein n=1 Tax=Gymnopilus dilepis TaxID=231916 RepID=A0A409VS46_9AGAR|nr:hypothetical protein CVT26_003761 [Gymnopilus dilepis]
MKIQPNSILALAMFCSSTTAAPVPNNAIAAAEISEAALRALLNSPGLPIFWGTGPQIYGGTTAPTAGTSRGTASLATRDFMDASADISDSDEALSALVISGVRKTSESSGSLKPPLFAHPASSRPCSPFSSLAAATTTTSLTTTQAVEPYTRKLSNISFSYPPQPSASLPILKELNLTIYPGECVAVVGASGSGKNTLAGVMGRVWDVQGGVVEVGVGEGANGAQGVDMRDVDVNWLRSHVVHVPQQPALLSASIAENIRFGLLPSELPDEVMHEAARLARVHVFIVGGGERNEVPRLFL